MKRSMMSCDYEGDLVAEVSRSTTSAEQVIKQPFQFIKVYDDGMILKQDCLQVQSSQLI